MVSIETLEKIGSRWIHPKTGEVRYYVSDCWKYGGLYVERYNSGNISYSELNGEEISHTKADGLIVSIQKCWVTEDGEVHLKGYLGHEDFNNAVIAGIKAAIAEMEAPETVTETTDDLAATVETEATATAAECDGATEWTFDDCRVIRDGDILKVIIKGPYDYRMMEIASSDIEWDVAALDSGSSPVGDGWEDGTGRTVCYDNGVLCDEDGGEIVDVAFVWNRQTYHIRVYDVEGDVWRSLAAHDEDEGDDLCYHLEPQDVIGVNDAPAGAHLIDSWDDVEDFPDESLDDFLCGIMAEEDGAAEMIERAAGDVLEAAKRFVASYFEGADEDSLAHEQQLRYYRMTPHELAGWLAREWEGDRASKEITATLRVAANGNGLMIACTKQMHALGLDRGDMVNVTIRRL